MGWLTIEINVDEELVKDVLDAFDAYQKGKGEEFDYMRIIEEKCSDALDIQSEIANEIIYKKRGVYP